MPQHTTPGPVPKRRRTRTATRKIAPAPAAQPATVPVVADVTYETNVAPDLIESGRSPERSDVAESECSLPGKNGAGPPD